MASLDCLIVLKIRAWLDLNEKRKKDSSIRSREVNKHRNDILRLEAALPQVAIKSVPEIIKEDIRIFEQQIRLEKNIVARLGKKDRTLDEMLSHFNEVYSYIE